MATCLFLSTFVWFPYPLYPAGLFYWHRSVKMTAIYPQRNIMKQQSWPCSLGFTVLSFCCMSSLISVVIIPDSNVGWTNVGPTSGRQYRRRASVGLTYTAVSLWGVPIGQMWIPLIKNKWCGCWRLSLLLGETSYQTEDLRTIWDVQMTSL